MFKNNYLDFEPTNCKKSCTQTTYEIHKTSELAVLDYYFATKLTFKPFVHVTRSTFSISVIDTITSLGGSVSFYLVYVSSANGKNDIAQSFVAILCALGKFFVALAA